MRPLATLQRAQAHKLTGAARAEARALLAGAFRRVTEGDLDGASGLLSAAHEKARSSALLHTGVHVGELGLALRLRAAGRPASLGLQPLVLEGVSSWLRRAAGVSPDAPQGPSLWATWQSRPRDELGVQGVNEPEAAAASASGAPWGTVG